MPKNIDLGNLKKYLGIQFEWIESENEEKSSENKKISIKSYLDNEAEDDEDSDMHFENNEIDDLTELDEETLAGALAELPRTTVSKNEAIPTWVDLLAATGVVDSKSAARRIVKEGGAYLNNEKISGEDFAPQKSDFLCGKYAVLRKGKRDLAAVELT